MRSMAALIVCRRGELPLGSADVVVECGGRALVIDVDGLRPGALAAALAERLTSEDVIVLPASPDGRDLAPRIAATLDRPLLAGAVHVTPERVVVARRGGSVLEEHSLDGPFVVTLEPGVRGIPTEHRIPDPSAVEVPVIESDPEVVEVTAPDAADLDLVEAKFILAVGAGLGDERYVELAGRLAEALGMSLGATRVVTDRGWLPFERQIGTTGAMVDPDVYVAIAISGAVQHVSGLGEPDLIVSVNTDGSCPMSSMAEINLVADGRQVLVAIADRLGVDVDPSLRATEHEGSDA